MLLLADEHVGVGFGGHFDEFFVSDDILIVASRELVIRRPLRLEQLPEIIDLLTATAAIRRLPTRRQILHIQSRSVPLLRPHIGDRSTHIRRCLRLVHQLRCT